MTDTIEVAAAEPAKKALPTGRQAPALWKQLLGACSGALVALGLYAGYQYGGETIAGYLTPPGWSDGAVPVAPDKRAVSHQAALDTQMYEMQRVASEAARMAAQMSSSSMAGGSMAMQADSEPVAMEESSMSSQASSGRSQWRTGLAAGQAGSRWSAPNEQDKALASAKALPDSGFPLIGVVGAALGGAIFRRRRV